MGNRLDEFRKRQKLRHRKNNWSSTQRRKNRPVLIDRERPLTNNRIHPLFSKEAFVLKVMLSVILFLVVAILFKQPSDQLANARQFVIDSFEKEFQFAVVSGWYENQFGKPLALFPENKQEVENQNASTVQQQENYAVPASGQIRILESFEANGKGIMIETGPKSVIESVKDGYVVFMGERENIGKTVIVQHDDGSESWYGNLQEIDVALYDYIKKGDSVGKASMDDDGENGVFYFALKKGNSFIDPIQVISFD